MAAAYAALVSLVHLIDQIQHHPRPPFYLDQKHTKRLIKKVTFLQNFLEDYSRVHNDEIDRLQSRITEAAYKAEDVIETHVVDQILAQSAQHGRRICSVEFYQDLQKVVRDITSIKNEVMEIKEKIGPVQDIQQQTRSSTPAAGSSRYPSMGQNTMVGCDDVLKHIKYKLTRQQSNRQIIPIVGMGGIGKTTLAKNVYEDQLIKQHFYIRAWATISQEFRQREILLELLLCQKNQDSRENLSKLSEAELRERLYKSLCGRSYLIILDDMWSMKAWDKLKFLFPNNDHRSRVIITTRQSDVALGLTGGDKGIEMNFLNDDMSWELLCKTMFGEDGCPLEFEETGKKIARSCKGLPLSIVVIGGLLAKSKKTAEYWEYIAQNLHSLEEKEHCLNLLYTSYNHLPVHLKPCFLYMGIFEEDNEIYVPTLIGLWVVEGFLKPISGKSLEEVGVEYLKDLVDRNLILVEEINHNGEAESCKIHDLLRDLCLKESQKDKFLVVTRQHSLNNSLQGINTQRRVSIQIRSEEENQYNVLQIRDALQSALLARTFMCNTVKLLPSPNYRLLRVLANNTESSQGDEYSLNSYIFQLVNLRWITVTETWKLDMSILPSLTNLFWNLQTLVIDEAKIISFEIWKMPLLRILVINQLHLTNPGQDDFVLENLHMLMRVFNFRCSEKLVKRIPNIKVLGICYDKRFIGSCYCLNNLARLHKLEQLFCGFDGEMPYRIELVQNLTLPHSLKELTLSRCRLHWEDISTKLGSLPLLQVLSLDDEACMGPEWETIEGQFCSLKILKIKYCSGLKCWKTDSNHFPCLERLVLEGLHKLEEIPSTIGHISTLRLIQLRFCSNSALISADEIAKEQEEFENPDLHVQFTAVTYEEYEEMKSMARPNFEVVSEGG